MLAIPVTEVTAGETVDAWPPHITLVPWFDLQVGRWAEFDQQMRQREIVYDLDSRVRVVTKDEFGDRDHPITVARLFGIMSVLAHARAATLVNDMGASFDKRFTGLNWHAHVSDSPGAVAQPGDEFTTDTIAVFEKSPQHVKRIKAVYARDA